ncbi:hypothetical protein NDU88_004598 [Pleurodeles waltl]|uniref:Uncharacterized protein n=1 Tax=Pleurodeles waltl TaxID=8319 RepID=A0AAV7V5M0_PLEWA|nr:hypothetical protein NDU88_004598 [Pleurodeles waltl]
MTADGTRRFHAVTPHKGQSELILCGSGCSKSRRRLSGAPGQQTPELRLCVHQGDAPKADPSPGSPRGPPPPCLSAVRSPSVREHQAPPPKQEADSPPAGAPTRRSGLHPSFRAGPHSRPAPGAAYRSVRGRGRNPAVTHVGPGPHRGARVRRRPPPGPRPHSSHPGSVGRSPAMLQHREPPGTARLGPARRPGRDLPAAPSSPSHSGLAPGGRDRISAVPPSTAVVPLHSGHRTARFSASRHRFKVGPSGADQLSVRHARLRGHAPFLKLLFTVLGTVQCLVIYVTHICSVIEHCVT